MKYEYVANFPRLLFFEGSLHQVVPGQKIDTEEDLLDVWGLQPEQEIAEEPPAEKKKVSTGKNIKKKVMETEENATEN
tara:strand:+ start:446 stop:679 length:234 start_codon:yes stop_codon:yes gene_type:complete